MSGTVEVSNEGPVAVIRFSNPPDGYMDEGTEAGFVAAIDQVEADDNVRAVVLTGADKGVFIRHYDVRLLEARGRDLRDRGYSFDAARPVPEPAFQQRFRHMETSAKPYIAALNGTAMGGGFELALACDIRIAEQGEYWFGLPESKIGLFPGAGGTQRLPRLIGEAQALEFILMGRTVGPDEAARLGLVTACVPAPVLDHAMETARTLAAKPANVLAHIKRLIRGDGPAIDALAAERTLFCDVMVSDESIDLMTRMNRGSNDIRNP